MGKRRYKREGNVTSGRHDCEDSAFLRQFDMEAGSWEGRDGVKEERNGTTRTQEEKGDIRGNCLQDGKLTRLHMENTNNPPPGGSTRICQDCHTPHRQAPGHPAKPDMAAKTASEERSGPKKLPPRQAERREAHQTSRSKRKHLRG